MGRAPCCDKLKVKRGPWSPEEDIQLKEYMEKNGIGGNWIALPHKAGLKRRGKSCRLRWLNYLRPNIKHGDFSDDEDRIITTLFACIGSRWSIIAAQLPGRTDNDIKNYWNTKLKKKLLGIPPSQRRSTDHHKIFPPSLENTVTAPPPPPCLEAIQNSSNLFHSMDGLHGKDIGFENYIYDGFEDTQKLLLSCGGEETPLDQFSNYEEINHMVSLNNGCSGQERVMHSYY